MVDSHAAGAETFKPLVEESTSKLLARHCSQTIPVGTLPPPAMKICFVGVENRSAEEIGDFKDQIYQTIDMKILDSHVFQTRGTIFVPDAGPSANPPAARPGCSFPKTCGNLWP